MNRKRNKALDSFDDNPESGIQNSGDDSSMTQVEPEVKPGDEPDVDNGPRLLDMTGNDDDYPPAENDVGQPQEGPRWTDVTAGEDVIIPNDVLKTRLARVQATLGPLSAGVGAEVHEQIAPADEPAPSNIAHEPDILDKDDTGAQQPEQVPLHEPGGDFSLENLAAALNLLSGKMDFLASEFSGKLKYDSHKDKVIDSIHKELQDYRGDIAKKNMQSMVMDLIKIIDDLRKITVYYKDKEAETSDVPKLINALEGVSQDLEEVLSIQGVEACVGEAASFTPSNQRALRLIPTAEPSRDKTVAYSIAPGFEWGGRVLRKEMVAVYTLNQENGKIPEQ